MLTELHLSTPVSLCLTPAQQGQFNLRQAVLTLRRSWPRSAGHLGLEYLAPDGRTIAGQWFADPERLEYVARATAKAKQKANVAVVEVADTRVLLQSGGADRRLLGLAPLLAKPGARLLVHRPERRAVVRLVGSEGPYYAKVVRPERLRSVVNSGVAARELAGDAFATPKLLAVDDHAGVATWSALSGQSLNELMTNDTFNTAAGLAGAALRALHEVAPPASIGVHSAADEVGVLQRWIERLAAFDPYCGQALQNLASCTLDRLTSATSPLVLLHRDFYDKQIFIDDRKQVGLLDFDTLTTGEAALDLANALVHFELRVLLGKCSPKQACTAAEAMLTCYQPDVTVRRRLNVYADATRLRLACVYAFRPYGVPLVPDLLASVGQSVIGNN